MVYGDPVVRRLMVAIHFYISTGKHKNDHFIRGTRNVNCNMYNSNVTTLHYHCYTPKIYQLYFILNLFFYV